MHHKEKYVIAGGRVIDPDSGLDAIQNVYVENGKITKINLDEIPPKIKKIDATGLIVAPGFIDLHVHLREPGFEYKEDIESGSQAAASQDLLCPLLWLLRADHGEHSGKPRRRLSLFLATARRGPARHD